MLLLPYRQKKGNKLRSISHEIILVELLKLLHIGIIAMEWSCPFRFVENITIVSS